MSEKIQKTIWVTGVQPVEVDGNRYIPTTLLYERNGKIRFGVDALNGNITNNNFKIDLGDISPGVKTRRQFPTEGGDEKSAYELSKDFFDLALESTEKHLAKNEEYKVSAKIIVAEPLNFQIQENYKSWVQNYRGNIRRILSRYEEVEFLPEPFAVYQYYRYGQRIPHLQEKAKHIALVLDFGGGTFDACIIESTNQGDISQTGKHSKPLGADSAPIGGFFINQCLAEYLIKRNTPQNLKADADNCIKNYPRIKSGELDISTLSEKKQIFIKNLKKLISACEEYKISLTSSISSWSLHNDAYERIQILIPSDPFTEKPWIQEELFAHQLRKIFIEKVWDPHIQKTIKKVFKLADGELTGKDITITLISGGSSNIRWMLELLKRDFENELTGAEPVPITQSFQEVVAIGLAIECARRFYEEESEFVGVTYNPIRLRLDPDNKGFEQSRPFISISDKVDMKAAKPGDLMPSAAALNNFIDQPLQWRIKLSSPPKKQLKYIFSKPTNGDDHDIYNAESQIVYTRENKQFDSSVIVQLEVSVDGTAKPTFIYKQPNPSFNVAGNLVEGKAFAIDMTSPADKTKSAKTYIGFDFGSCSSAISMITQDQVKTTKLRAEKSSWLQLSSALSLLPYPVASPLRKYLDVRTSHQSATVARETFEAALTFLAYVTAAEALTIKPVDKFFKSFQHRSMGPLKDLLMRAIEHGGKNLVFCARLRDILPRHIDQLEKAVDEFTKHKHEKLSDEAFDSHNHLFLIVNLCLEMMRGKKFGYISDSRTVPFNPGSSTGHFKIANDIPPFPEALEFKTNFHLGRETPLILNPETGKALALFPLMFWSETPEARSGFECYLFDKPSNNKDSDSNLVKPCSQKDEIPATHISRELDLMISETLEKGILPFYALEFNIAKNQEEDSDN